MNLRDPRAAQALPILAVLATVAALGCAPSANADPNPSHDANQYNGRFNNGVVTNVYTIQQQAGCPTTLRIDPKLRLAAQWQTEDVLNNPDLDGDIGSDGSTTADRARNAGFTGNVAETVGINPALAMSGIELINQWYNNPAYLAIMQNCAYTEIGVWSENSLARTVVVAVYGQPT